MNAYDPLQKRDLIETGSNIAGMHIQPIKVLSHFLLLGTNVTHTLYVLGRLTLILWITIKGLPITLT